MVGRRLRSEKSLQERREKRRKRMQVLNARRGPQHTEPGLDRSEQAEPEDNAVATGETPRERCELQAELARSKQQTARLEQQLKLKRRSAQRDLKLAFKRGGLKERRTLAESKRAKKKKGAKEQRKDAGAARRTASREKKRKGEAAPEALHSGDRKLQRRADAHLQRAAGRQGRS